MFDNYYKDHKKLIQYGHTKNMTPPKFDFHLHNLFEIYYLISGDINYFIEKKVYSLQHGDLLIMNSNEIHRPSFLSERAYERITIHFDPSVTNFFSSQKNGLLKCFINRPLGEQNKISLNLHQINIMEALFNKLDLINKSADENSSLLMLCTFIELLVYINNIFKDIKFIAEHPGIPDKLLPILDHINKNLKSDLSLENLSKQFFINQFYLSRLFKKSVGSTIHEYINVKRISNAKMLLAEHKNATEAAFESGFNDYSCFFRMFKRVVGISPGKYRNTTL